MGLNTIGKEVAKLMGVKGQIVNYCLTTGTPILVTLKNRKVYVGFVLEIPYTSPRVDWHIKILPLRSGYRCADDLKLILTQDYEEIWKNVDGAILDDIELEKKYEKLRNAGIVINWEEIEIASKWIPEIYNNFNSKLKRKSKTKKKSK